MISTNDFNQNYKNKPVTLNGNWYEQGVQFRSTNAENILPKDKLADQFTTTNSRVFGDHQPTDEPSVKNGIKHFVQPIDDKVAVAQIKKKMQQGSGNITKYSQFANYNPFEKTSQYSRVFFDEYGNEHISQRTNDVKPQDTNQYAGYTYDQLYKTTSIKKEEGDFKYRKLMGDNLAPEHDNETSIPIGRGYYFKDRKEDYKYKKSITSGVTSNDLQNFLRK